MGRVEGKIALVTGAAMGLGLADATMLIEEGARVLLTDVNVEAGQKAADALGENAAFAKLDVSSPEEWASAIATVEEKFGGLDVLVNNAGIVIVADPESCTYEDFKKTNAIMNDGVFLGMQSALCLKGVKMAPSLTCRLLPHILVTPLLCLFCCQRCGAFHDKIYGDTLPDDKSTCQMCFNSCEWD